MLRALRLLPAALLVASAGIATTACASQIYGNQGGWYRQGDRRAYDVGYREGLDHGQSDARKGRDYAYAHDSEYRDADRGYDRSYGSREQYRRQFRQGYEAGYSEGYRGSHRNGGYGNNYPGSTYPTYPTYPSYPSYPNGSAIPRGGYSPAGDNGYRDGFEAGRSDARDRDRYDPVRAKRYREGDHNYNGRYGSRDEYKRQYRAAFEQGYREGYGQTR
jgi:hypothetical protein